MEIGEKLKEAREANNITLDSLQETTKIQKRYLVAIEEGNFHILPGVFYARAFIKEYATAVGLDANALLEMHEDELPSTGDKDTVQYTRIQRSRRRSGSSRSSAIFSVIPTIIVVLLLIGILFVGWTLYQKSNPDDKGQDPIDRQESDELIRNNNDQGGADQVEGKENEDDLGDNDTEDEEKETEEKPEQEPEQEPALNLVESGTGQKPESTFELVNTGDTITLTFEPTGRSWLEVQNVQGERLLGLETAADTPVELEVEGEDSIWINIGFAPALPVIKINDIELDYPMDTDQFYTQRFWIHKKEQANE